MRKYLFIAFLLAATLPMTSCRRAVEKARENIRFEGIESVDRQGLTGAGVTVRIKNGTGYKLVLDDARLDVYYAGGRVASILLRERVEVARRTTVAVPTRWQMKISDPLALFVVVGKLHKNDLSQIDVGFSAEGRGGPAPVKIAHERMPLSEFMRIFGVSLQDVKNYLRK